MTAGGPSSGASGASNAAGVGVGGAGAIAAAGAAETPGRAFLRGLTEPNALSLVLALVVGLLPWAAIGFVLDEDRMATDTAYLFSLRGRDAGPHLATTLLRLRRDAPAEPVVALFGASDVRNGYDAAQLQRELSAAHGAPVRVLGLMSGLQRPIEMLAMVEEFPERLRGIVVVGVSPSSFAHSAEHVASLADAPRVAIRSRVIEEECARHGIATPARAPVYFWDNRRYFLPRLAGFVANVVVEGRAAEFLPMPNHGKPAGSPRAIADGFERLTPRLVASVREREATLDVLDRIVAAAARRGMRVVLLEGVVHPSHRDRADFVEAAERLRADVGAFAAARGLPFLRVNDRAALEAGDFVDAIHVRSPAAAGRLTSVLAGDLAPLVAEAARAPR